ncbi:hypothetical protein IIV31_031L [Armadillidium vulgare iridescent virus]|uniref:MSV199 domain-containing protein n=1 Tax=Armadillidium vulgare iridescent virus TaxID=72201 RepID=A0A068QKP4_9VIRU|nr:hypothetical protein IIV31_031L [Armadillidium vulgare iridescent virus]CCV02403.1 hypothetical protein IIV31_031L [Armadillidium vulgare iridescent virus]
MELMKKGFEQLVISEQDSEMLNKALDFSLIIVDIIKFVEITNFDIDPFMIEKFWHSINDNSPLYISREILEWMGYTGDFGEQRKAFKKLLRRKNIEFSELSSNDPKKDKFPTIQEDILSLSNAVAAQSKWLIMNSDDFKDSMLMLNTKNSGKIRRYYRSFEKLMKLNLLYTLRFRERSDQMQISSLETLMEELRLDRQRVESRAVKQEQLLLSIGYNLQELQDQKEEDTQKIDVLIDQNEDLKQNIDSTNQKLDTVVERLGIAVEDRAPRLKRSAIRERFVLFKKNSSRNERYQYYAIRGQSVYVNGRLTKLQIEKYPNMIILIDILCQPNPRNLFLRFKERIDGRPEWEDNFTYAGNNVGCSPNLEQEMINIFTTLDEEKRDV